MKKIDYKKEFSDLYKASAKKVSVVEVSKMNFLMIDGKGNPNTAQEYKDSIETLYPVAYTLKFMIKKGKEGIDYGVMPLEGLWYVDDMTKFSEDDKDSWKWTMMIMQPDIVTEEHFKQALEDVKKKDPPSLSKVRYDNYDEGTSAQILHMGPYSEEKPTIEKLHDFISENGFLRIGHHHEIYLNDPRRCAPEKLKTIIRQPMKKVD